MPGTRVLLGLAAALVLAAELGAQTSADNRQPIARIGAQEIYEQDLLPSVGGQLFQLEKQEYDLKLEAVSNLVNQRLLEAEAKSKGLSVEAFLQQTVDQKLPPWNIGELDGFYLAQKDRYNKPLDEIRPQVEQALIQAKIQQARKAYMEQLRSKAGVTILLSPNKIDVSADSSRLRGSPDAPITIVEFGDFQCPYCQEAERALKEVLAKYPDRVQLGFRDFPLRSIHPQAQAAAEASRCAEEQGKFWEYHDLLYTNQARLDPAGLNENARTAGLNTDQFQACLAGGKYKAQIEEDLRLGAAAGVSGTPAFYINGAPLTGSQPASAFEHIIDAELAKINSKVAATVP
jgi:protein-disulfide isomerase